MNSSTVQVSQVVEEIPLFLQVVFTIAATTTLIIWNVFSTLDEEVEFIWPSNFTFVKGLFFVVRYLALFLFCGASLGFFGNLQTNTCMDVVQFITISGSIVTACSNMLLIQRVYAFYGCSKRILWALCLSFGLSESLVIVTLSLALPQFRAGKDSLPSPIPEYFGRCIFETYPRIFSFAWFCKVVFEAVAFTFIAVRFASRQYTAWKTGLPSPRLYNVLFRDGTWAFFILFFFYLSAGILMHGQNIAGLSLSLLSYALSSIVSTRLILNLHHAAKRNQPTSSVSWDSSYHEVPRLVVIG